MIKINGVCETKVYNNNDKLNLIKHTLDTEIQFDVKDSTLVTKVYNALKEMFGYEINPEPLYVSGDDNFFTFQVFPQNDSKLKSNDKLDK